ncbi:hypothetical protein [Aeromonas sp. DNP9]|uniref:hypothetical protein n=1 Tax=Aeromonas sp. DNP9 TaxID=1535548 RepID=UPI00084AF6D0|nr:hypothetical protein [Aeromonas sp. DNP9]OEC39829.1 hypothetical protein A9G06_16985 [Aeromonas sp. DNP9]
MQVQGLGQLRSAFEETSDFETFTHELAQTKGCSGGDETGNSGEVLGEDEVVEMILEQTIINNTIRQMKQSEQQLEEILNET